MLAPKRYCEGLPLAFGVAPAQNVKRHCLFKFIPIKWCWRSKFELGRFGFRRMIDRICLFGFEFPLGCVGSQWALPKGGYFGIILGSL
jgi:hypothetical protein